MPDKITVHYKDGTTEEFKVPGIYDWVIAKYEHGWLIITEHYFDEWKKGKTTGIPMELIKRVEEE
jgi:hypothetical protein